MRQSARVLLLDETDRLLLMRGRDPSDPGAGSWWFTPGGGLEAGEDFEQAGIREVAEETGQSVDALYPLDGEREVEFVFDGRLYVQSERYFTAKVPAFEATAVGWTENEARSILELRWWTREEFEVADVISFPEDLVARWAFAMAVAPPLDTETV